jgi:hypothetical protein
MANKVQLKAAGDQDFTDNDPFAELTRIMGFDPRVQPTPRPDEDFEIDLEKELMGMFDPGSDAPTESASVRDYPQEAVDNAPALDEAAAAEIDDAFAAKLEEELSGSADLWNEEQEEEAAGEELPPLDAYSDRDAYPEDVEDVMAEVDMDFGSSQPEHVAPEAQAHDENDWAADDIGAGSEAVQASLAESAMPEEGNVFRPAFFTPLDADRAAAEETGQAEPTAAPVFDIRSFKSAAQQYREAQPRHQTVSFEQDGGDMPAAEPPISRAKAVDPFNILAALGTERGLPQRRDPLKANARAPEADDAGIPERAAEPADPMPEDSFTLQEGASRETGEWEVAFPATAYSEDAYSEEESRIPVTEVLEEPQEMESAEPVSISSEDMPFFDIRSAEIYEQVPAATDEEEAENEPHAVSASDKGDTPDIETTEIAEPAVAIADDLDIPVPAFLTEARAAPAYDELDEEFEQAFQAFSANTEAIRQAAATPEQPSEAQTSADIERLFAEELGIGSTAAAAPVAALAAVTAGQAAAATQRAGDGIEEFDFDDADFLPDEFATNTSRETRDGYAVEDTGTAGFLPRQMRLSQGRGKLVAAAIAGVVVLGGIGAFAFSGSGIDSGDKPVVLKADADPVKIKPKNPGGMTVPNQDNKVYERVADGATAVAPEQKKLVSTEEHPIDIAARTENAASALPGVFDGDKIESLKNGQSDDGVADSDASSNGPVSSASAAAASKGDIADIIKAAPKGEDRLAPSQDATPKRADNEILSVTPHKVKTMIVRADGTMVPREDPAPTEKTSADAGVKTAEADAVVSTDLPSAAPIPSQEPQVTKASEAAARPAERSSDRGQINTPAKVAAAPTRPANQPADVANAKPQKVASAEAAPAPAPVTEASGNWSVQIASQPTAEAAQTSYQNMARRYASILGGHAVNIVKADISGKGTYYRVRIATSSKDDAIALCTKYKAAGGNCFVSK